MKPNTVLRAAVVATIALSTLLPWSGAHAGDAEIGRQKAMACAVCHGPLGLSVRPDAPSLAGQPEIYVVAQMRAYRSGARHHEIMNVIAKPLSDQDIAQMAAWFASIRVEAQAPR
jgi:cytochrome c553